MEFPSSVVFNIISCPNHKDGFLLKDTIEVNQKEKKTTQLHKQLNNASGTYYYHPLMYAFLLQNMFAIKKFKTTKDYL